MRLRFNVILVATAAAILAFASTASAKGGSPTYDVVSTVLNGDGTTTFVLQSDNQPGNATASALYSVNDSGVNPFVGASGGGWQLGLGQQTIRNVYLDFSKLQGAPVASGYYNAVISSSCYGNSRGNVSFLSIAAGTAQTNCSFRVQFHYNGGLYLLAVDSKNLPSGSPATGRASVGCNSDATDNSGCNSWTITPYNGGSNSGFVDLLEQQPSGLATVVGSYSGYTFRVDLQR